MLEKEPTQFNLESLRNAPDTNRIVGLFYKWLELSERAADAGIITLKPNPSEFLEWIYPLWYQNDDNFPLGILSEGPYSRLSFIDYKTSYENLEVVHRAELKRTEGLREEVWELNDLLKSELKRAPDDFGAKLKVRKFDNRERKTLLKILLSVAISKYRYKLGDKKSSTAKNIETTTLECNLGVTDETIRAFLKEATIGFPEAFEIFED